MNGTDAPVHGGPDGGPPITLDFSTNAHPLGPTPSVLAAVQQADRSRYPDPQYGALAAALARFHGVDRRRVVIGGSASELIWRLTRLWSGLPGGAVAADAGSFGEYRRAALGCGLPLRAAGGAAPEHAAVLRWHCSPGNPGGAVDDEALAVMSAPSPQSLTVADLAYRPFLGLLDGADQPSALAAPWADAVVQLWSPNKLHGLTGVRGAYLLLPAAPHAVVHAAALDALAPAWVLGADGAALLHAHLQPDSLHFLRTVQPALEACAVAQRAALARAGWQLEPGRLHYGLARPPVPLAQQPAWHAALREHGVKLRDAASFARPGWVRLRCLAPPGVSRLLALTRPWCAP